MTVSSVGSSSLTQQMLQLQKSMFATADADSDGSLSLSEFESIGQNVQGGGQRPSPPPMGGSGGPGGNFSGDTLRSLMSVQMLGSDSGSILSSSDANSDGLLSADEISSALSANAPEDAKGLGLEEKMASDMISAFDSDDDGSLSSDEIAAGRVVGVLGHAGHARSAARSAARGRAAVRRWRSGLDQRHRLQRCVRVPRHQ